ncbi:MAG: pyrroline-5-carboxylate reductase [Bdellovibrionaceae bacterium]|nr:pyrroline-5-carboxylate reductase [Pseudobdellovibrionaceae bacterium]
MNSFIQSRRVGFIGAGNMSQAIISGIISHKILSPDRIFVSNRSPGKLRKVVEQHKVNACNDNEAVVESADIVVLAMKPQDLASAVEPLGSVWQPDQIVLSLAAGIRMDTLLRLLPGCRVARLMPNTPSLIGRGVIGYLTDDESDSGISSLIEDLFSPLGFVLKVESEEQLEAITVAAAAGTGFVFEIMMYWQDWLLEHGFQTEVATKITVETFLGAALLADRAPGTQLQELQNRVASRKGVTAAGLESMRELEIERALRISFEKAALKNSEIARQLK